MKQQTPVEWLIDQLEKYELYSKISFQCLNEIEEAKEMEKKHIMDAHKKGYADGYFDNENSPIDYYNETYENK
jgi:phosphosulfolactate phosphohydrolase-like enzyme